MLAGHFAGKKIRCYCRHMAIPHMAATTSIFFFRRERIFTVPEDDVTICKRGEIGTGAGGVSRLLASPKLFRQPGSTQRARRRSSAKPVGRSAFATVRHLRRIARPGRCAPRCRRPGHFARRLARAATESIIVSRQIGGAAFHAKQARLTRVAVVPSSGRRPSGSLRRRI